MDEIQKNLQALREQLQEPATRREAKKSPLFGGADVSFVLKAPAPKAESDWRGAPTYVVTPYARELSWVVFQLKEIFSKQLNYGNKYAFYGRLAEAANAALEQNEAAGLPALWAALLEEAEKLHAGT
ncbi:hypothetical protein A3SI_04887 [Nitritalea halalkaliphila LW7]|uniref:Uncharacterized protein n=1 Tax=Nitritalea halalkaliphila LW7 TaxID=1189621 RepID=I5C8F0_9BACT|nr:hypothetical protein [Nitritalea halalkaliphila]EIM78102.1 hypothetical protein A3SI_04887 [Nitritalea halalkaliphila LW7]